MPSKKDLEQQFGISDNTVYKTIEACGLDTAKEDYSEEEIENFFKPARQMLDSGKKYKDVIGRFQMKNVADESQNNSYSASASDAVGMATAEMAVDLVQDAVKQITPHIPQLVAHTLAQEMRSPEMKKAFTQTRAQIREQNATHSRNAGADFLQQKMNQAQQLEGSNHDQAQLPEASQPEKLKQ